MDPDYCPPEEGRAPAPALASLTTPSKAPLPADYGQKLVRGLYSILNSFLEFSVEYISHVLAPSVRVVFLF